MSNPDDIHGFDKGYEAAVQRLNRANITDENKELIRAFVKSSKKKGNRKSTYTNDLNISLRMALFFNKALDTITEDDFDNLLEYLESKKMVDYNYRKVIKKFFRWLKDEDMPSWVRKVHLPHEDTPVQPSDLLTRNELDKLLNAGEHPRDRALVAVALDSLMRIGAIGTLRIKSVVNETCGALIYMSRTSQNNKTTPPKPVPLTWSTGYLNQWLSIHPLRDDPEAPLWVNLRGPHKHKAMTYNTLRKLLEGIKERAGITKDVWFHLFKHQGVTDMMLKGFSDQQIKFQAGWTPDSDRMMKVYGNFSAPDMIKSIYAQHGLKTGDEKQVTLKQCPRCHVALVPEAKVCHQCALVLDSNVSKEMDAAERALEDKVLARLLESPEMIERFKEKLSKVQ
jgi:integrase